MTPHEKAMWDAAVKFGAPRPLQPAQPEQSISLDKIIKAQKPKVGRKGK
jgi:hypothetical protein